MTKKLIGIGEALIDFIPQTTGCGISEVEGFGTQVGGAPANVCAAFAKLGGKAQLITQLGQDPFGDKIVKTLDAVPVDTSLIRRTTSANTSLAFVSLQQDGNREFSFYRNPGSDMLYRAQDLDEAAFADVGALHFCSVSLKEGYPMYDAHLRAIELARRHGGMTSFDPNLRLPLFPDLEALRRTVLHFLPQAELIKLSDEELPFLTGETDIQKALPLLLNGRTQLVLYTRGKHGASAFTAHASAQCSADPVRALDTTGAGDGFIGAILHCLLQDGISTDTLSTLTEQTLSEYLEFANRFCSLSVQKHGAISSYPSLSQMQSHT